MEKEGVMALPRPKGSVWEEELLERLERHAEGENELLASYSKMMDESPPHVRYLVKLLLADEARHHRVFEEMANALRSDIEFRDISPSVPRIDRIDDDANLLRQTEQLLQFERADLKSLRDLAKELKPVRKTTLWSLLVEMMELDTEKHIRLLRFIAEEAAHT